MRHKRELLQVAAVLCFGLLVVVLAFRSRSSSFTISLPTSAIEADGATVALLEIHAPKRDVNSLAITSSDPRRIRIESVEPLGGGRAVARLRAGVLPGEVHIRVRTASGRTREVALNATPSESDSYRDGTPDFLRLADTSDIQSFRRWFGFLAESQFFAPKHSDEVTDCAALVRYAYRESLRGHDSQWAAEHWLPHLPTIPEVHQYRYPNTPLGASLFRTQPGPFAAGDLRGDVFAEFADANTLRRFNMHFVSRRIGDAESGDVIFFRQNAQHSPYHAMIYLERSAMDGTAEPLLIYHTGPIEGMPGEIRRPTLRELMHHPDARWRPLPQNPAFLGVYRWNILRGTN